MGSPVGPILGVDVGRWEGPGDMAECGATIVARLIAAATWSWTIRRTSASSTGAG